MLSYDTFLRMLLVVVVVVVVFMEWLVIFVAVVSEEVVVSMVHVYRRLVGLYVSAVLSFKFPYICC